MGDGSATEGAPGSRTEPVPPGSSRRWFHLSFIGLVFAIAFYRTSQTLADPDLWGHIKFGLDVIRARAVPSVDRYSYLTAGYPYREWEWLSKAVIGWFYDVGGTVGLVAFKTAVSLGLFGLMYRHLRKNGFDALRGGMVLLLSIFLLLPGLQTVRVHLFTYLCFLLFLLVLHAVDRGRRRLLWVLPPLFAAWANLHPGVLAGVALLGVWSGIHVVGVCVRTRRLSAIVQPETLGPLLVVPGCVAATFVNPFGAQLLILVGLNVPAPRPEITEFEPIRIVTLQGLGFLALLAASIAGFLQSRRPRHSAEVGVFACACLFPLLANRHLPLFVMSAVVLSSEHLADAWQRWTKEDWSAPGRDVLAGQRLVLVGLCGLGAVALTGAGFPNFRCIRLEPQQPFPARGVALLKAAGVHGNMAVLFDWGDYVLWHLDPDVKVSVDGRRESTYSKEVYDENLRFQYGAPGWDRLITKHPTDVVLVGKAFPVVSLMKLEPNWTLVYEDSLCAVFAPEGSPFIDAMANAIIPDLPQTGAGLCFPGP